MIKELEDIKKKIIPILKRHNVKRVGIFGSYVGESRKKQRYRHISGS